MAELVVEFMVDLVESMSELMVKSMMKLGVELLKASISSEIRLSCIWN